MNLAWCVIALTLAATDDPQPRSPQPPNPPFTVQFTITGPAPQAQACQEVAAAAAAAPPTAANPDGPAHGCPGSPKPELLSGTMPVQLPKVIQPRTTNDSEAKEEWLMTLDQAIRIGLDNSEIVRVISFGAQGIPIGGFEPTPLKTGASAGVASSPGAGTLQSVKDSATFQMGLSKQAAYGGTIGIVHNVIWSYQNSSFLVWPSAYTTNIQLTLTQPLPGQAAGRPVGLEANRAPIVIARLNADASAWRFKSELMAHVRSIEQLYWHLAQTHVQLWSAEQAVRLGQDVLTREQAELTCGRGTFPDVAEAAQRLEQFNLDLVTRTSDLITAERQLRNILGLPPSDNRRIITVTKPTEEPIEFDWDTCLNEMIREQPDVAQQQILTRLAELHLLIVRNQLLPQLSSNELEQLNGIGQQLDSAEAVTTGVTIQALKRAFADKEVLSGLDPNVTNDKGFTNWSLGYAMPPLRRGVNTRSAQYTLLRSRAHLRQVVHQTTHTLARFFLEVDANYKQYHTASRLRNAAAQRLDAQRAYYEEGRITVDRLLDAIGQFATALATEHQYLATYNISLAALSEAKGTLLADRNIVVAERPRPTQRRYVAAIKTDDQTKKSSFEPAKSEPAKTEPATGTSAETKPGTWTISISIGSALPVRITGTYSPGGQPKPAKTAE